MSEEVVAAVFFCSVWKEMVAVAVGAWAEHAAGAGVVSVGAGVEAV